MTSLIDLAHRPYNSVRTNVLHCDDNSVKRYRALQFCVQVAMRDADIAALLDAHNLNAGFLVIRPSSKARQLYMLSRRLTNGNRMNDQGALNKAVNIMKRQRNKKGDLRVKALDRKRFINGAVYFEMYGNMFRNLSDSCRQIYKSNCPLVVHNNWIVSKEAKIYRFREHLMWLYDGENQYYSSETRKYLTYTNPTPAFASSARSVTEAELSDLKTALVIGRFLNRVVILPRFHCGIPHVHCILNSIIHLKTFDSIFSGRYRESSFLNHPKVPNSVKQGLKNCRHLLHAYQHFEAHLSGGDVLRLFSEFSDKVLDLGDLRNVVLHLDNISVNFDIFTQLQKAFRRSCHRQLRCWKR